MVDIINEILFHYLHTTKLHSSFYSNSFGDVFVSFMVILWLSMYRTMVNACTNTYHGICVAVLLCKRQLFKCAEQKLNKKFIITADIRVVTNNQFSYNLLIVLSIICLNKQNFPNGCQFIVLSDLRSGNQYISGNLTWITVCGFLLIDSLIYHPIVLVATDMRSCFYDRILWKPRNWLCWIPTPTHYLPPL